MRAVPFVIALLVAAGLVSCTAITGPTLPAAATKSNGEKPHYDRDTTRLALLNGKMTPRWSFVLSVREDSDMDTNSSYFSDERLDRWINMMSDFDQLDTFKQAESRQKYRDEVKRRAIHEARAIDDTVFAIPGTVRFGKYDIEKQEYPVSYFSTLGIYSDIGRYSNTLTVSHSDISYDFTISLSDNALRGLSIRDTEKAKELKPHLYEETQRSVVIAEHVGYTFIQGGERIFNGLCWVVDVPELEEGFAIPMNIDVGGAHNSMEACEIGKMYLANQKRQAYPDLTFGGL